MANITPTEGRYCTLCEHYRPEEHLTYSLRGQRVVFTSSRPDCGRKQRPTVDPVFGVWVNKGPMLSAKAERTKPTFTEHLFRVDKCGPRGTYFVAKPQPLPETQDEA